MNSGQVSAGVIYIKEVEMKTLGCFAVFLNIGWLSLVGEDAQ